MQLFAVTFISLQGHSTCFGCFPHPSSGVDKNVTTASVIGHIIVALPSLETWSRWKKVAATIIRPVPEAVVTISCIPDDWCGENQKHVE